MATGSLTAYEIQISGSVGDPWINWFDEIVTVQYRCGATLLTTRPIDQETLVGILNAIRDFNCRLVSVNPVQPGAETLR
jgi:hypothetical protein